MNIIIDIRPLIGGKHSGVEIYIRKLLENLFKTDRRNKYVLFANSSSDQSQNLPRFKQSNVTTIQTRIPNKILNSGMLFFGRPRIDKLIRKHLPDFKPDLYFSPDLRPFSLGSGIKIVCVVHDLSFRHFPGYFSLKTRIWHKLLDARRSLRKFDKIIAVSEFTKRDLNATFGIDMNKIVVINEGVDDDFCRAENQTADASIRAKYALPKDYFLFLSTLEPRKNLTRLIEAFKLYKQSHGNNFKLVLVGTHNPKIFSGLRLDPHEDLVFTGFVPENEKPHIFRMAAAFLYPSLFEGFGLPLLEAMKCGTPIITSNCSSMPEICGHAALYVNPEKTGEIAGALDLVLQPKIRNRLKAEMAARVKHFSWKKCADETLRLFESI